ncbi:glycoside hydrolase family 88 protein [Gilvimarinus polysaccharolyticus]|uniref:glycoside hydrolase family 88 protein n=1 Tax=Gilvimarinus polysaccharolyticus TaxID=863921 RepID=UPI000673BDD0|nr:glycoside hydrolase family 88 protein [Gilvimarinus polysaccharolyticus]
MPRFSQLALLIAVGATALTGCQKESLDISANSDTPSRVNTSSADNQAPLATITLSNPSEFERIDEPYRISFEQLGLSQSIAGIGIKVDGRAIPSQTIDADGNGSPDSLFTLLDIDAAQKVTLTIHAGMPAVASAKRSQAEISRKTGGSWQEDPEKPGQQIYVGGHFENVSELTPPSQHTDHSYFIRYEGPGIESDLVGYRVYLDWRNGFDIFGKHTHQMALQNIGQDGFDSYHKPADWGMDILKVGNSVGSGGYGFWNGKSVERVSEVNGWDTRILDNGNLYSAFSIDYKDWKINHQNVQLNATLAMRGGSRLVHTQLKLDQSLDNLAIGIVKHPNTELIEGEINITGKAYTYVASWGKQSLNDDQLGMALLFRKSDRLQQTVDEHNYVSVMNAAGEDIDYYFLGAWEGEKSGINSREALIEYLEREAEKLTLPLRETMISQHSEAQKNYPVTAADALNWSKRLADSELKRKTMGYHKDGWDVNRERLPKFEYDIVGLLPLAYDELNKVAPAKKYADVMPVVTGSFINDNGEIARYQFNSFNIDSVAPGRNLIRLYEESGKEKYKIAANTLREQLEQQPKTSEGAFWHKQKYTHQLWLDGVYMGMPFLAHYAQLFENGHGITDVVNEFKLTRKYLRDANTGLYYHAWDEKKQQDWANPETGLSGYFWARGMGWLAMALVDVLDYIPVNNIEQRQPLLDMIQEMAIDLKNYQDPTTGTWWQIMDQPQATGNYLESSASAMFTYFYAKAVHKGYLGDEYKAVAQQAYDGLIREFITVHSDNEVSLTNICYVAGLGFGRNGSYDYYMSEPVYQNDPKGTGPFILAGIEMYKLLQP